MPEVRELTTPLQQVQMGMKGEMDEISYRMEWSEGDTEWGM